MAMKEQHYQIFPTRKLTKVMKKIIFFTISSTIDYSFSFASNDPHSHAYKSKYNLFNVKC